MSLITTEVSTHRVGSAGFSEVTSWIAGTNALYLLNLRTWRIYLSGKICCKQFTFVTAHDDEPRRSVLSALSDGLGFAYCAAMTLVQLWHSFLGLHPWRYVIAAALALAAFIKRKAFRAATLAVEKAAKEKFFGWLSKNLPGQQATHEKTYKGIFMGFHQYSNFPHEWFFTVSDGGIEHKVPTMRSNLLSGVQDGGVR